MTTQGSLRLLEGIDVFFEDALISRELILQKYADFFESSVISVERSSSLVLHTGSVCFDVVSFIMAVVACISIDQTDPFEIIEGLNVGNLVLYRNQRHRWLGIETKDDMHYIMLEQDGRGKGGAMKRFLPFETNKGKIKPYYGSSEVTDGRGIKRQKSNRRDFITFVTGKEEAEIPSITGVSVVIVADRVIFDQVYKGVRIEYGKGKTVGLLDIVPASYYTDGDEPYQFGSNPSKTEPVLKITGKVSTARDLVLNRHGNKVVGLMVMGADAVSKGSSELVDLLSRRSLKFTSISMSIGSEKTEDYVFGEPTAVFACTREFLLKHSKPTSVENAFTSKLNQQVYNIVNSEVRVEIVDGGPSWETYREIRNALFVIRRSDWDEEYKREFIVLAHSLLNLVTTAVFPMASLEQAVSRGQLHVGVSPPATRIEKLWALTERADSLESLCAFVVASLDDLYKSILTTSSKHTALIRLILNTIGRIAIVVPKLYYANMLLSEPVFSQNRIYITTANRFDGSQSHDRVIVVGDFSGKRFDPLKCRAAADIVVLLHECETKLFDRRKAREMEHERKLNAMNGPDYCGFDDEAADADLDSVESFASEFLDVEEYIDNISVLDISKFAAGFSSASGGAPTAEVLAVGRFVSGEQIIFSKYYRAVVYKPENTRNPITETDVDKLSAGDILVFAKRDDFTRNIVDSIYETLQTSGKLSKNVLRATEKAQWWKKVLRDYQLTHDLSYRQLREELVRFGCSLTEVSIRQWLVEESHIVGPRDEETLRQIAEMTQDGYLLDDVPGYFDACRVVRAQRRRILELIGEAIEDKLRGHQPPPESELEIVYDNVENLSETLELQSISFLNESVTVPVNLINKPMSDLEVT